MSFGSYTYNNRDKVAYNPLHFTSYSPYADHFRAQARSLRDKIEAYQEVGIYRAADVRKMRLEADTKTPYREGSRAMATLTENAAIEESVRRLKRSVGN